jgi:hypothetical protein
VKKHLIAGISAIVTAVVLVIGGAAVAQSASASPTWDGRQAFHAHLMRNAPTLTAANGSYTNLTGGTNTSAWSLSNYTPFGEPTFSYDSDGLKVPVNGVYNVSWSVLLQTGGSGVCGIAIEGDTPNGGILHGIGAVVNSAAAIGNGSASVILGADDEVNLWCYGSGGTMTLQSTNAVKLSVDLVGVLE